MAFRTNLMPTLQEKSASGSVATFNTALAMPLVECKVAFSASQEGSGTPSPVNVIPIIGKSSLTVTANSVPVIKSLGNTYFGGELDLNSGVMTIDWGEYLITGTQDIQFQSNSNGYDHIIVNTNVTLKNGSLESLIMCDKAKCVIGTPPPYENDILCRQRSSGSPISRIYLDFPESMGISTTELAKKYFTNENFQCVIPYYRPVEIQLTPEEISTIIGDNTFTSDGDSIFMKYLDLDIAKRGNFREVFKLPS